MDPVTIGLLLGAGSGLLQGEQNEKKMYQDAMLKANLAKFSPWSNVAGGLAAQGAKNLDDSTASLFKGAAMGAQTGGLLKDKIPTEIVASTPVATSEPGSAGALGASPAVYGDQLKGANMLGGVDASNEIAMRYGQPQQQIFIPRWGSSVAKNTY